MYNCDFTLQMRTCVRGKFGTDLLLKDNFERGFYFLKSLKQEGDLFDFMLWSGSTKEHGRGKRLDSRGANWPLFSFNTPV